MAPPRSTKRLSNTSVCRPASSRASSSISSEALHRPSPSFNRRSDMATVKRLFRSEALAAHQGGERMGEPLNLMPRWLGTAYWTIAWTLVAFLTYSALASVVEYAEGPALIRIDGRRDLVSVTGGSVMDVDVEPGQAVEPGQVLARLYSGAEEQELDRVVREFELRLV